MNKKIIFCCLAMGVSIIPLISGSPDIALKDHYQQAQQLLRDSPKHRIIEFPYDPVLNFLCAINEDGDYPNPFYCNFIIKCSDSRVFLEVCPGDLDFNPFFDGCTWPAAEGAIPQCPSWPSVWGNPSNVQCETVGQDEWSESSPVMLPSDSSESCGRDYVSCKNFTQVAEGTCGDEEGYSKTYLGCLPLQLCNDMDRLFDLL